MAHESTLPDMRSVRKRNGIEGKRLQHVLDKISHEESLRVKKIKEQIRQASHESYYHEIEKEKRARQLLATYVKIQRRRRFGDKWKEGIENLKGGNSSDRGASRAAFTSPERDSKSSLAPLPPIQVDGRNSRMSNFSTRLEKKPSFVSLPSPQKERRNSQVSFVLPGTGTGRESRESFATLPSPSKERRNSFLALPSLGRESRRSFNTLPSPERERSRQSRQTLTPSEYQRRSSQVGVASREMPRRRQASSLPPIQQDRRDSVLSRSSDRRNSVVSRASDRRNSVVSRASDRRSSLLSRASDRRPSVQSSRRFGSLDRIDSILSSYGPANPPPPQVYVMQTFPFVYHSDGQKDCPRYTVFLEHKDRRKIAAKTKGRRRSIFVPKDDWAVFNSDRKRASTQSLPSTVGSQRKLQVAAKMKMVLAKLKVIRL